MDERSAAVGQASVREGSPKRLRAAALVTIVLAVGAVVLMAWRRRASLTEEGRLRREAVSQGPYVRVAKVEVSPAVREVTLPGEVQPFQKASLYAKVAGYVVGIYVDKGDRVKQNQLLAKLESPDVDEQVRAGEADLALRTQMAKRAEALVSPHVISDQELDQALAAEKTSAASLARAKALREYESLRAPFSGVITARYVDKGALVPAATGSTQNALPVVDIAQMDRLRIYVYLGQDVATFVREGDPVRISIDSKPGQSIDAKVTRISRALDPRTRTMLCEIDVDNEQQDIYPGVFVHVNLSIKTVSTPLVPAEAVITQANGQFVASVQDRHVHFVRVQTGIDDGRKIQILSGLKGGESVAVSLPSAVGDGAAVQPVEPSH